MTVTHQGVCLWLTGRSGAGKSTVTKALLPLLDDAGRTASVYDVVPLLAKSWCERTSEGKLLRKAFVAGEVARHGGIAICVTISGREEVREAARSIVGRDRFLEVYFDTPPHVSARRKAARGRKTPLTKRIRRALRQVRALGGRGKDYQVPKAPDLTIDTSAEPPEDSAQRILELLVERGYLSPAADRGQEMAGKGTLRTPGS